MARDRRPRDDEDDEDERPRAKRRRDEDEDEDEAPRPKRKPRPAEDDEEEERPRKKARARDEDDEEEEPRPKKKARSRDEDEEEDEEDERPRRKGQKKGGMSKGMLFGLIGGGVALVLVVVLLIVFLGGGGTVSGPPKAVFEAYAKELKAGRGDRALEYLAAAGRMELENDSRLAGIRPGDQLLMEVSGNRWLHQTFTVSDEKIAPAGNRARVVLRFEGRAAEFGRDTMEVDLVKEGSKWKIEH